MRAFRGFQKLSAPIGIFREKWPEDTEFLPCRRYFAHNEAASVDLYLVATMPNDAVPEQFLESYRPSMVILARMHLDRRLWAKLDPEDMVQQTCLEAVAKWGQFTGTMEQQCKAWVRQILLHNILDEIRKSGREVTLELVNQSSVRLLESLAAAHSSPSQRAARNEELDRLAEALLQLTDEQQQAVILHHLHGLKLADVAETLGRKLPATAGLIHRGLKRLKEILETGSGS
jgi:RNA polymerase sigma-70 factor (ECF subfamily)